MESIKKGEFKQILWHSYLQIGSNSVIKIDKVSFCHKLQI